MPQLDIQYDEGQDLLTIEGVVYHGEYFRRLARPREGFLYKLDLKEVRGAPGKVITLREIWDPRSKKFKEEFGDEPPS